jgi:hypothetical protein
LREGLIRTNNGANQPSPNFSPKAWQGEQRGRSSFMSKTVSKLALAAGLVLAMAFTFSCSSDGLPSSFVGKWVIEDGSKSLELFKDGTGIYKQDSQLIESISITWKVMENKRFVIANVFDSRSYAYEMSGKKLTLTNDKGEKEVYGKTQ